MQATSIKHAPCQCQRARLHQNIDVYENAHDLGFVGAGIQLAPNMARVLDTLGVWKGIEAEAVNIIDTSVRGMYKLPESMSLLMSLL